MKSNIAGPKVALIKLPAGREREREGEKVEKEKEGNYEGKIQYSGQGREGRNRERRKDERDERKRMNYKRRTKSKAYV